MKKVLHEFGGRLDHKRCFVSYFDDAPERADAVAFFKGVKVALFPQIPFPREYASMPQEIVQQYLDAHPLPHLWDSLSIYRENIVCDEDLSRLQYIPEIVSVKIMTDSIGDVGLGYLSFLSAIESLTVYSIRITDVCLESISKMKTLRTLDLQGSPNVSQDAYYSLIARLPLIEQPYPPRNKNH